MSPAGRRLGLGAVAATALLLAAAAEAHEFWIEPKSFWLRPHEATSLAVLVGHGADRQRWRMRLKRIVTFASVGPDGAVLDRRADLREGADAPDAELRFDAPGEHLVVMQTDAAFSSLPGDRFEEYLRDEGLTPAIEARRRGHASGQPGTERYSRRAKALVQVGAPGGPQARATTPFGFSLEITPEVDPYRPAGRRDLPVRVSSEGRPLAGALVKLTDLNADGAPAETHRTDRLGRAVFRLPTHGAWEFGAVWTRPLAGDPEAAFETTFASLSFGFPATPGR